MQIRQDGPRVTVWAPAKLNLFLRILGQRPDGYHELVTLMTAVDLYDTLTLVPHEASELTLISRDPTGRVCDALDWMPAPTDNLVYKALLLLRAHSGCQRGARVELVKRIPPASGLGGGSSDAAAALLAGNLAWGLGYSCDELMPLAAQLGSDVPFFLQPWRARGAAVAVCRGRGERVEPARAPAGLHFVVARPSAGLSTAEVYRRYEVSREKQAQQIDSATASPNVDQLLAALAAGREHAAAAHFVNDLQSPAFEISPAISALAHEFAALNPIVHQMSGSGSAYCGWFRHGRAARQAAERLRHRGYPYVWQVQTI